MKKSTVRIFAIVLAALMCLSLLPLTVAHAEEHVHVFEPTTIPPTCGEEGYVQMICEACGFGTEILEFIPPTGEHVFASVLGEDYLFQTSDNICETPEVYWKSCTVCGAPAEEAYELAKQRALDELNQRRANGEEHSDAEWQDMMQRVLDDIWANYTFTYGGEGHAWVAYDGQEATCEQDGWKPYRMCANCGAVEDYEVVPAKGHRWGEQTVVTEPTCDTEGLRRRVCEVCGKEDNEIIPALGHKYGEATVIKAPTCTEDGMQQRVCSVCGAKADEVIPALGHKFGAYAVIKAPTCTEDGVQERVCSVCGEKETEAIPAAHKFGEYVVTVEPGCYSSGEQVRTCTVCGATESEAIPAAHKFGAFVVTMEPTCYSTGERRSTCTVCGEEIVEWIDTAHKYENGVCVFCGEPAPEGYVAPAVEAAAVTETENTTETQGLILSDSETFDAGDAAFTVTLVNQNTETKNRYGDYLVALKGDTVQAVVNPYKDNLIYIWSYENANGGEENITTLTGNVYNTGDTSGGKPDLLDKYLFCVVRDPDTGEEQRSDNIPVRAEVTLSFEAVNGTATISYTRTNAAQPPVVINNGETKSQYFLTQDVLNMHLDPADGFLYRQIAYLNTQNVWVPVRTLANADPDYPLIINTSSQKTWQLMADSYTLYNSYENESEMPTKGNDADIRNSGIADTELQARRVKIAEECGVTQENVIPSEVIYVTPVWNTGKLAMNSVEISHTNGFDFKLPLPMTIDESTNSDVRVYHFSGNSSAGVWELVPKYQVTVDYVAEEVLVSGYKDFTPFAVVVIPKVIVEFDGNGADGGSTSSMNPYKSASMSLPPCGYTKTGAGFKGWSEDPSGSVLVQPGEAVTAKATKYYAIWETAYTITYDKNADDAVGSIPVQGVFYTTSPVTATLEKNNDRITREFYEFKGWTEDAAGSGTLYTDGQNIELSGDVTLYAQWEQTHFTVSYDANGGEGAMTARTVKKGGDMTLDLNTFTYEGKIFIGWVDNDGAEYADGATFTMPEKNLTLHAVWKNEVKITFYANNGTDTTKEQIIPADTKTALKTLKELGINDPNKQFVGWGTGTDSDPIYKDGEEITESYSISLYAQWRVTVHFYANGGTGTMDEVLATRAKDYPIKANSFVRNFYTFTGWNTRTNGSGDAYPRVDGLVPAEKMTSDVSLYAQWEKTTFKVDFMPNGGTGSMAQMTTNKGADFPIPQNDGAITRVDYTFTGWNTKSDGTGDSYTDQGTIPADKITDDFKLYAQWRQTTFTISFNKNTTDTVTGTMAPQKVDEGATLTLNENAFKRTDYTFMGWSTTPTGSAAYGDKAEIPADTFTKDTTLYAVWRLTTFTVKYSSNGGTGTMDVSTIDTTVENTLTLREKAFTRQLSASGEYAFMGWNTKADGTGTHFDDKATITAATIRTLSNEQEKGFTLYAQWKAAVLFDGNTADGDKKMDPQEFDVKDPAVTITLNPNGFTKTNYTFDKWTENSDGTGTSWADQGSYVGDDSRTLYAQWIKTSYAVNYDNNGGGGVMTPDSIEKGRSGIVKENTFNPPDSSKVFGSWLGSDGKTYNPGDKISTVNDENGDPIDITLSAQWKNKMYVIFHSEGEAEYVQQIIPQDERRALDKNTFATPEGKAFVGWKDAEEKTYTDEQLVKFTNDAVYVYTDSEDATGTKYAKAAPSPLNLYAVWKQVDFNVTFNKGTADGTETMEVQKITDGVPTKLTRNAYTYTKHQFREWKDQDGKTYKDQEEITEITKDLTLTAQWDELVTVTFNANNGNSEETGIQQEVKGSTAKLTAISDLRFTAPTNMEFDCWNTVQEPTTENPGTKYRDKADFTFSADTTLYAQWKPIVVTIRFEPGEGSRSTSTAMPPITVNAGSAQKLPKMSGFTLARHSFTGWSATADGAVLYADEGSVPATATAAAGKTTSRTITLYARWKQTTFTISFAPSGGSGTMAAQNIDKNTQTSLTLRPNRFVKTVNDGESTITYKFMGWTTTSGGTTVIYEDGETIPADDIDEDMTLYAVWDTVIIFRAPDADAGSTMTPQSYDPKADTVTLKANTFTRENYRFESWRGDDGNTYANQETLYKDSATLTADKHKIPQSPLTLTAVWTRVSYAVSYDPNGGGGTMDAQSVQVGQSVTLKDSEFTAKPGMIFGNWNTARDGSGSTFAPGATVMPTGDVTLYAQWKDPVNVYYYPGTGDGTYKIVEVPKGVETALKSPADLGYTAPAGQTFAHWRDNDTGETYTKNEKVKLVSDTKITAVYADTIAISYNPNGGSLTVNGTTSTTARKFAAPKGEPYTLYTAEQLRLTRSGYEFKGWGQSESDRSPDYIDGGTYTFDGDKELFAIWQKHTFDGGVLVSGEISGIGYAAYVGETLTATAYDDYWKEFNYKWVRDDGTILLDSTYDYKKDGIDTSNVDWTKYVVQEDDYGHDIYCEVTAKGDEADTSIVKRSNVKTVTVEEDTKRIVNNGNTEQDYVYGLTSDMTYTVNSTDSSKGTKVVLDTYGRFAVTQSGTYRFYKKGTLQATVYVENWYTIGYATNGSGTVSLKLDNTSLTSSTRTFTGDLADKIEYYPHISGFTCWIVKEGASIGTFTLTVQGSSSNYTHVYLNEKLLDSFGSTTRTTTSSSSSSRTTTTSSSSSSSSSSTSTSRSYTVSTPLERDTRYTTAPWKMFEIVFNSTSSTSSPRTGDASNLGLWSALCLTSVTGTAAVLTTARKRRKSKG